MAWLGRRPRLLETAIGKGRSSLDAFFQPTRFFAAKKHTKSREKGQCGGQNLEQVSDEEIGGMKFGKCFLKNC